MSDTRDPEEVLRDVWRRVEKTQPPVPDPPGKAWHFALGALFALGSVSGLDDARVRRWEAHAQMEAKRLSDAQI
jgi:hypothetical protein